MAVPKQVVTVVFCILASASYAQGHDLGAVTAIASVDAGKGAYAGYSSGAVVYCGGTGHECRRVNASTTPDSPVTAIDVYQSGSYPTPTAWVGYDSGAIYRCSAQACVAMTLAPPIKLPDR